MPEKSRERVTGRSGRSVWECDACGGPRTSDGSHGVSYWVCENKRCRRYNKPVTVHSDSERDTPEGRRAR